MKRFLIMIMAATMCCVAFAQPKAKYLKSSHDFGIIKEGKGNVSTVFELQNVGDKPLVIIQVTAACGCTRPEFPTKPIKPGEKAKIKVTFSPSGRKGEFLKEIKVKTNGKEGRTTLTIRGNVVPGK